MFLTPRDIAIVMEHATNGDLFDYVSSHGQLNEDEVVFCSLIQEFSYLYITIL